MPIRSRASGVGATWPRTTATCIIAACLALLLAACGGSPTASDRVATLDSPGASASSGSSATPSSTDDLAQQFLAYAQCMRDHGLPNYPDPQVVDGQPRRGGLTGTGIDPSSSAFHAASAACYSVAPTPPPEARQPMSPQDQAKWVQFAACARSHGVPNFPDPDFSNGGPKPFFDFTAAGVDGQSPTVAAAIQACRSLLPVIGGASGGPSSTPSPSATAQP